MVYGLIKSHLCMYLQDIRRNIISPNDDTPFRFESQVFSSIHYYLIDISRCVRSSSAVFSVASSKILPTDRLKKSFYTHLVKYLLYENQQSYEKAHPLDSSNQKCVPIFYIILCIDKCIKYVTQLVLVGHTFGIVLCSLRIALISMDLYISQCL